MFEKLLGRAAKNELNLLHNDFFEKLRKSEYRRLDVSSEVYLDYTGGNLYPDSLIDTHHEWLKKNTFGNPHSINPTSERSSKFIETARQTVLDFFNASDYHCIFTQNASGALKIVGESYPFSENSQLLMTADNHNSVNGIREFCINKGGKFDYVPMNQNDLSIDHNRLLSDLSSTTITGNKLFAYPAQSNVSGVKHSLDWIQKAHDHGWDVLLDAAAFVPTSVLDLQKYKPDFVSVSFYKIFGYPTGLGCLLVHNSKFDKLQKQWFAGGTVKLVTVKTNDHNLNNNYERFEDGTVNYLNIPAIQFGLDFIRGIGIKRISERVYSMRQALVRELNQFKHSDGTKMIKVLGPDTLDSSGSSIVMLFYNPGAKLIPFQTIELLAAKQNISLRAGCFCNPGIDETIHAIEKDVLSEQVNLVAQNNGIGLHAERGSVRVSVGLATNNADLLRFLSFVKSLVDKTV